MYARPDRICAEGRAHHRAHVAAEEQGRYPPHPAFKTRLKPA